MSKIFPGTVSEVTVFVPVQYDGYKPACVYVKTDGFNPREKTLLEMMIATKECRSRSASSSGQAFGRLKTPRTPALSLE